MATKKEKVTFEMALQRLDEIVKTLERGQASLDESLALFEEGTKLLGICGKQLDAAEQKVVRLTKGPGDEPVQTLFDGVE